MPKTKAFIEKARAKHGDRYDYSKAVYVRSRDKVIITCKTHGDFEQRADDHLKDRGCARCSGRHRYSTAEWITVAKTVHGDRYAYDNVVYVRGSDKVVITCREHGEFEQEASIHLRGCGCHWCSLQHGYSTAEWIVAAKTVHGNRYDYDKVAYTGAHDKVIIICRDHGEFEQTANNHLSGFGCAKCSGKHRHSTAEWIAEAKVAHGDRYDYSEVVYTRGADKIIIDCRDHGSFEQKATSHLQGNGCPRCPTRCDEPARLYIMANNYDQVKIGYSIEPKTRLSKLNRDAPFSAELLKEWVLPDTPAARTVETEIHQYLAGYHAGLSGFDGATEWFNTTPEYAIPIISGIVEQYKTGDRE